MLTLALVLYFDFHAYSVVTSSREVCPTQVDLEGQGFQAGRRVALSAGASPEPTQKPEAPPQGSHLSWSEGQREGCPAGSQVETGLALRPCSDSSATPSFPSQPEGKIGLPRANPRGRLRSPS